MLQIKEPTLLEKIQTKTAVVGVCGLGYVGLPLALTFGEKGFPVIGFDIDKRKIDAIEKGQSYIKHIKAELLAAAMNTLKFERACSLTEAVLQFEHEMRLRSGLRLGGNLRQGTLAWRGLAALRERDRSEPALLPQSRAAARRCGLLPRS